MNDLKLTALIRRYYPLSPRGRRWRAKLEEEFGLKTSWLGKLLSGLIIASLTALFFYLGSSSDGWSGQCYIALGVIGSLVFLFGYLCYFAFDDPGRTPCTPTVWNFLWRTPNTWNLLFWLFRSRHSERRLRVLLRNPYHPELILGTVEAIEAELMENQAKADALVTARQQSLESHRARLTEVSAAINQRLNGGSKESLLDQGRLSEASATLEQLLSDLAELEVLKSRVATSLRPAKQLAESLRRLYADALEVDTIARAKGAVADDTGHDRIRQAVAHFQQEALQATETLSEVAGLVGAKLAAEAELEALIGIQPHLAAVDRVTTR